jgi:asparagine synthase (glutamine-hydrolysing)
VTCRPDWSAVKRVGEGAFLAHERLAIVSPDRGIPGTGRLAAGDQPLTTPSGRCTVVVNGEVYNASQLKREHSLSPNSSSDSEVVGMLYEKHGDELVHLLDGIFAFILHDNSSGRIFVARDHMGICPLYKATGHDDSVWFASEMKCFAGESDMLHSYDIFPPGHTFSAGVNGRGTERWYNPRWLIEPQYVPSKQTTPEEVRQSLVKAVEKRMTHDVPFGVLLSGGLDSSLVTAIAAKHAFSDPSELHSFSIGLEGAPDLLEARRVAAFVGTHHHEFNFTTEEALDAIPDVVYHLESWEQIRASVPMFLLARKIKALGFKMVLSGEGADETFGGYLYFHEAPSANEFHAECVRKTARLHQWDVMRANKSPHAWGVEARVPFLDMGVLDLVMNTDPKLKMINMNEKPDGAHSRMEKYLLRKAFDCPDDPYLPDTVLWRQKEQFSDGVGYDWVDALQECANTAITDSMFAKREQRFKFSPPSTKEYYMLRSMFESYFPEECASRTVPVGKSIACSTPEAIAWKEEWMKITGDISGRAVGAHQASEQAKLHVDREPVSTAS